MTENNFHFFNDNLEKDYTIEIVNPDQSKQGSYGTVSFGNMYKNDTDEMYQVAMKKAGGVSYDSEEDYEDDYEDYADDKDDYENYEDDESDVKNYLKIQQKYLKME